MNAEHAPSPGEKHFPPFAVDAEFEAAADKRIAQYPEDKKRSAVLPLLHNTQHKFGYIAPEAIEWIASKLGIEPIQVLEVVSFYPGFRQSAPGKFHIRVCRTLSCAMAGSAELMDKLEELTGADRSKCDPHHSPIAVSPDGTWSLEFAECLASCGTGPVVLVNDDFHEDVPAEKAAELMEKYNSPAK
ncbi:complex I 24 kDa subunit family protein [Persicirhabdus sediminis]|uniref:NAD(P)H-dependent oxidoreductase subunit E n=1 Tax=Persicirhabdus sediminis TaxID=454144 RepID=A0A8J7SJ72_9BACT|nr:NAD(P)H-dependent oxidoreductase subunit E [Persicirhabdus sediminis]MBK1790000.1 NAD(P)H-dependent oxidoreductase subunit E [Persicirhabdus sediminis]